MKRILAASGLGLVGAWLLFNAYQAHQSLDQFGQAMNPYQLKDAQSAVELQVGLGVVLLIGAGILLAHWLARSRSVPGQ